MSVTAVLLMMVLAFAQNVSFSIVSRARNRDNQVYHLIAAVLSNGVWFATFRYLAVVQQMDWLLFIPYTIGTVTGSVTGSQVSMWVEKRLGIKA